MSIPAIKEAVNLVDVAREYGELHKSGPQWLMLCLWHSEQRPSCRVYKDHFYCYTCQASGDLIDMVAKGEGVGKGKALAILSDRTGIPLGGKPLTRRQRVYDSQEKDFAEWWQKATIRKLGKQLTAHCIHGTEEDCESIGILLRQVQAAKGQELRALALRAGDQREWREDRDDAIWWTWFAVEALCL